MKTPNQILEELTPERQEFLNYVLMDIEGKLEEEFTGTSIVVYRNYNLVEFRSIEIMLKRKLSESKWGLNVESYSDRRDGNGLKLTISPQEKPAANTNWSDHSNADSYFGR